ncbi:acetate/propionate family kinase [Fusobacterium perfoetens]|uniref:acetate/propionate family kinase n=1 Tax=Fusobacterium perfoetens TaxID=852 RepID=UPI0004809D90|nr:acetate kinase [Fusobacterium perfoetens]MCI6152468.1 acetate kinase [Fusobacterium perfoetens]MDY3238215.1 acetate kinase [Fusobacterium perfoetens]
MKVLVINCGSSSLKYQLLNPENGEVFAKGLCERIGIDGSRMEYEVPAKDFEKEFLSPMPTHKEALTLLINTLTDKEIGVVASVDEVDAIGHRVVHGGEEFAKSVLLTPEVMKAIEANNELAPLHNPANLMGIETCMELMPGKPNVGVFDTAFHQTMPKKAFMYALPYEDYTELKVRKYGFHGTSHKFVSEECIKTLGNPEHSRIIVCHLGNGASISAVKDGKCIDTSMGLTPLQGVMMGTRCGDIDPAAVLFIKGKRNLSDKEMDARLNKQSGILGIYGKSSDCRDMENGVAEGDERAILAEQMFIYKIRAYVGNYAAQLGGLDAICFTGGIGENAPGVRAGVVEGLEFMGVKINPEINNVRKKGTVDLSAADSKVKVFKIQTNEELAIARDTFEIVTKL